MGEEVRRAQSRGEWPGVRRTFLRGLRGMVECVGGGASELVLCEDGLRFGRGRRCEGGAMRPGGWRWGGARAPLDARWAELRAGKQEVEGRSGSERVKLGTGARGVVIDGVGVFLEGGGGGGIAFRSRTSFMAGGSSLAGFSSICGLPVGFSSSRFRTVRISLDFMGPS